MDDKIIPLGPLKACPGCRALVRDGKRKCPYCGDTLVGGGSAARWWRKFIKTPALVSKIIAGVLAAVFLLEFLLQALLLNKIETGGSLLDLGGVSVAIRVLMGASAGQLILRENEWWRLVTACLLHGSIIHIIFSCIATINLGSLIEMLWNPRKAWVAFVITGIGGSMLSLFWHAAVLKVDAAPVGASGAICGFLGMLFGLRFFAPKALPEMGHRQVRMWTIMIIVIGFLPAIDNAGHAGGIILGVLFSFLFRPGRTDPGSREDKAWTVAAYVCLALVVICVGFATNFAITYAHEVVALSQK